MKHILLLFSFFLCITTVVAQNITIDGKTYTVDTLANFKVGPGSRYTSLRLRSNNRLDVYFLKIDATNPYVTFRAALGRDSIYTGEQPSALAKRKSKEGAVYFAGTNGDFYATTGYVGYPVGGCVVDYELAKPPTTARKIIAFENDKIPVIGVMTYTGTVKKGSETWTLHTANHIRETNQLVLFNQHNGKVTRTNAFGTEVLVELVQGQFWAINGPVRVKVTKIEQGKGNMTIPKGMAVLSGHGTSAALLNTLAVHDELEINLALNYNGQFKNWSQLVGGDNRNAMLVDGMVETAQVWNELHPRTAVGYSQDQKTIIFCVVDGRGLSAGVTTKQLAELMKSAGAWTAFNMDGGGSSSMYVKEFGQMNVPSDGVERSVSNSLFAVSSAPTDPVVSSIECYETTIRLPRFGVFKPRFLGYNQYGVLINKDLQGVTLSCDPSTGHINEKGEFVFSGTSNGKLTATYNSISTTVNMVVVQEAEIFIRLDSILIDNHRNYPIEVQSQIGLNTMTVLPSALNWTVRNPDVCSVENGILTGLQNGTTMLVGNLGSFKDSIHVKVEIPATGRLAYETFADTTRWELTSSLASWNTHFAPSDRPTNWHHGTSIKYTFQTARSPFFRLTRSLPLYGLPDTIQLILNTGGANFSSVIMGMKAANASSATPITFTNVGSTADSKLSVPLSSFTASVNDLANFPVNFEYLTFYLNSSTHSAGQTYTIGLKEIALRYAHVTTIVDFVSTISQFRVYPNPTKGTFLKIEGPLTPFTQISISTINGKSIGRYETNGTFAEVSVQALPPGVYLLQIQQQGISETHRFIRH